MSGQPETLSGTPRKSRWRENVKILVGAVVYMIPLFWLWQKTNYPDGLGIHITEHGKAGLLENWWYSYLLVERHRTWDIVTFLYMWGAVVGAAAWVAWRVWRDNRVEHAQSDGEAMS